MEKDPAGFLKQHSSRGQNNLQEPTGWAAKNSNHARYLGQPDGTGSQAGTCLLSPPHPTPEAHNGVYGFGVETHHRTITPKGRKTSNPKPRSAQSCICTGDKSDD